MQKGVNCRFSTHFLTFFSVSQTCEGFRKKWVNFYHMVYRAIYVFFCRPLRARQLEKNQFGENGLKSAKRGKLQVFDPFFDVFFRISDMRGLQKKVGKFLSHGI